MSDHGKDIGVRVEIENPKNIANQQRLGGKHGQTDAGPEVVFLSTSLSRRALTG